MKFLEVLQKFEDKITNDACDYDHPEDLLSKTYIVDSFFEFIRNLDLDEDDTYYLRWYEEEHNKDSKLSLDNFIYHMVLSIQSNMDLSSEYLRLRDGLSEYSSVLLQKKFQLENELRTIPSNNNNKKDKIIFFKKKIDNRLKQKERFNTKYLIITAWRNCTTPSFMRWYNDDFSRDIFSVQNVDADRKNYIFFGDLSVKEAREMIALKKEDPNKYSEVFEKIIYRLNVVGALKKIVEGNYFLHDRLPIISAAEMLFTEKNYIAFAYLVTPQIEGLFRVLQQLVKGDKTNTGGMKELIKKMYKDEDFFEFVYFAYDFPDWRNKIAHGYMIEVNRELACEIMMALYWVVKAIDDDEQDYKRLMSFLDNFVSKQNLNMGVECLANYFDSMESKKNLDLLRKFLKGEFNSVLEWYGYDKQGDQFLETIKSTSFYLQIWNDEPLESETIKKVTMTDGTIKECKIKHFNDNSSKYYSLLSLLNEYNYVPTEWYKNYLHFFDRIEAAKKEVLRKLDKSQ